MPELSLDGIGAFAARLSSFETISALAVVLLAGVVRGYAGFGFSALSVTLLSLFLAPARVVPAMFLLEVVGSIGLARDAVKHAEWSWLGWLMAGNVVCVPVGIWLLASLSDSALRIAIAGAVLLPLLTLRFGGNALATDTRTQRVAAGSISGVCNGLAAVGGLAVAAFVMRTPLRAEVMRATLVSYLLFTDCLALALALVWHVGPTSEALFSLDTLSFALLMCPAMLVGIAVGSRMFSGGSEATFRGRVANLLFVLASLLVIKALAKWP